MSERKNMQLKTFNKYFKDDSSILDDARTWNLTINIVFKKIEKMPSEPEYKDFPYVISFLHIGILIAPSRSPAWTLAVVQNEDGYFQVRVYNGCCAELHNTKKILSHWKFTVYSAWRDRLWIKSLKSLELFYSGLIFLITFLN